MNRALIWRPVAACLLFLACSHAQAQNMSGLFQSSRFLGWMLYSPAAASTIVAVLMLTFPEARSLLWKIVLGWVFWNVLCFSMVMSPFADPNGGGVFAMIGIVFSPWLGFVALTIGLTVASKRSKRA
jgi:hypothetical protein